MPLVIDIETVGQALEEIPGRAVDSLFRELSAGEISEEELEQRRGEIIDRFGLDPTTGRIICIGLLELQTGEEKAVYGIDEDLLLQSFWEILDRSHPDLFVSFNGKRFDFPYINIRSAIRKVVPSMVLLSGSSSGVPHFDVREVLAGEDRRRRGTLDYFCAVFGIPSPKESLDGDRIGEAFHQGRLAEIASYCLADCRATAALFERLRPFYGC